MGQEYGGRLRTYGGPSTEFMRADAGISIGQSQGDDADDNLHRGYVSAD